jgi:hypothetical protein
MIVQGDADTLVQRVMTRRGVDELKSLNMTCEYLEIPGAEVWNRLLHVALLFVVTRGARMQRHFVTLPNRVDVV